jgi:hypothetical protein
MEEAVSDAERRRRRQMAGDVSLRLPFHGLYLAAMAADDDYRDTIQRLCNGKSRWSMTQEDSAIPAVKAAYDRKVEADRAWLSALRLTGHSTEGL